MKVDREGVCGVRVRGCGEEEAASLPNTKSNFCKDILPKCIAPEDCPYECPVNFEGERARVRVRAWRVCVVVGRAVCTEDRAGRCPLWTSVTAHHSKRLF
jgi:hypothetical protein